MLEQKTTHDAPLVLVIDDELIVRLVIVDSLTNSGMKVIEAENGVKGAELFNKYKPDAILLDVMMPEQNGYDVCRTIRSLQSGSVVPILMLTGLEDVESIERAYEAGATDFVNKQTNSRIITQRVRYMLRSKQAFDQLRRSEERLADAQRIAKLGNWELDLAANQIMWSDQVYRLLGLYKQNVQPSVEVLLSQIEKEDQSLVREAIAVAAANSRNFEVEFRITIEGVQRHYRMQGEVRGGNIAKREKIAGTIQDITAQHRAEARIRSLAYFDPLTGLQNRFLLQQNLKQRIAAAKRRNSLVAVFLIDLDNFKRINDTLGHTLGDDLLRVMAARLTATVRQEDSVAETEDRVISSENIVAHPGGDEFVVVISGLSDGSQTSSIARRLIEAVSKPLSLGGHEVIVTPSVGISVYPEDGSDFDTLLKNADVAMYQAKQIGRNGFQLYAKSMNIKALERLALENDMRRGIERSEFELFYQPQIDSQTGRVIGAEGLIRWRHPTHGLVSPGEFIPIAEESGLIVPLGETVLRLACGHARGWRDTNLGLKHVAVNLSARQFRQRNFTKVISNIVMESGVDPKMIELEITESAVMQNADEAINVLNELKGLGLRVSMDDFGTGYSSLSYLKKFPIDALKIDRSFIRDVNSNEDDAVIAKTIIAMGHSLRLEIVAEGVETLEQIEFLSKNGCHMMQGFYYAKPMPVVEFVQFVNQLGGSSKY